MIHTRDAKELWDLFCEGGVEEVHTEVTDTGWRHGYTETTVIRDKDERLWQGSYRVSGDGEHHEWRDEAKYMSDFIEVEPVEVTVIEYTAIQHRPGEEA